MAEKIVEIKMDLLAVCMNNIRKGRDELKETSGLLQQTENDPFSLTAQTENDH